MWKSIGWIACVTSIEYLPDIVSKSPTVLRGLLALAVHWIHDAICFLIPLLGCTCLLETNITRRTVKMLHINVWYTLVMTCFSYHKRCFLTLWYNALLNLDPCIRYIPVWQRLINHVSHVIHYDGSSTCVSYDGFDAPYRHTYLWLNDQILFSSLILVLNLCQVIQLSRRMQSHHPTLPKDSR